MTVSTDTNAPKPLLERAIETVASGLGNSVAWMARRGILFAIFAVLWIAVGAGLVWSQGSVHEAWETIRGLPLIVQIVAWVLFLPVMAGLWIWETTWPIAVRIVLLVGLAGWNLLVLLPRARQAARP